MSKAKHRLDTKQMASFVANGYLRFDELVPASQNEAMVAAMEAKEPQRMKAGTPLSDIWPDPNLAGQVFRLPEVQGIIHSLVGPDPLYDHHAVHIVDPGTEIAQGWHGDAIIDTRLHFDIQFFYFAHDTPREMGGTMILPGSHYRRINEGDISRYQNFKGQLPLVCKAGTLVVVHHGMWHCAQPNFTERVRYMFKLRLNPTVRQKRLWNTADLNDPQVNETLISAHAWTGMENRLEYVNRIKMWRFLTGDETYDLAYWMSRIENQPEAAVSAG